MRLARHPVVDPQNRRAVRGLTSTRRRTRVRSPKSSSSSGPPQSTGTTFASRSAPSSVSAPSGCHRSNPDTSNEPTPEHGEHATPSRSTWKGYDEQPWKPRDAFLPKDAEMALSRYAKRQNVSPRESCIDLIERDMRAVVKLIASRAPYLKPTSILARVTYVVGSVSGRMAIDVGPLRPTKPGPGLSARVEKTISGSGSHSSSWSITTSTRGS